MAQRRNGSMAQWFNRSTARKVSGKAFTIVPLCPWAVTPLCRYAVVPLRRCAVTPLRRCAVVPLCLCTILHLPVITYKLRIFLKIPLRKLCKPK